MIGRLNCSQSKTNKTSEQSTHRNFKTVKQNHHHIKLYCPNTEKIKQKQKNQSIFFILQTNVSIMLYSSFNGKHKLCRIEACECFIKSDSLCTYLPSCISVTTFIKHKYIIPYPAFTPSGHKTLVSPRFCHLSVCLNRGHVSAWPVSMLAGYLPK